MMGQFDEISKKADELTKKAADLAGKGLKMGADMMETGKIKLRINSEERQIRELYERVGAAVYRNCALTGVVPEYIQEDCNEIHRRLQTIEELQEQLNDLRPYTPNPEEEAAQEPPVEPEQAATDTAADETDQGDTEQKAE